MTEEEEKPKEITYELLNNKHEEKTYGSTWITFDNPQTKTRETFSFYKVQEDPDAPEEPKVKDKPWLTAQGLINVVTVGDIILRPYRAPRGYWSTPTHFAIYSSDGTIRVGGRMKKTALGKQFKAAGLPVVIYTKAGQSYLAPTYSTGVPNKSKGRPFTEGGNDWIVISGEGQTMGAYDREAPLQMCPCPTCESKRRVLA